MSRASKVFFTSSIFVTIGTVWGVHYLQKQESDNMYQGVVKDEARLKAKAQALLSAALPASIAPAPPSPPSQPSSSSSSSSAQEYNRSILAHSSATPLNTPSSPVQQPAAIIDPDCQTCIISPPPQLVESLSPEERRRDRLARQAEYEQQKDLGKRLEKEQGVSDDKRIV